jgi:pimeloyl-ACP methyl ester carboxylesterase
MRIPMMSSVALALMLMAGACGSDSIDGSSSAAETAPAVEPGGVVVGEVDIDGTTIEYATSVPAGFTTGSGAPVLLAFPPGGQDLGLAERFVEITYAPEARRLGWVVISPAAPDGTLYFRGSESLLPQFVDWIETWVDIEGDVPHIAGVSNGGISAFRYAAQHPDRMQSLVVLPGFPQSEADQDALNQLVDVPIRMYVGGTDSGWIGPAEETMETVREFGGDIDLTIFPGEGHVMASTADGTLIFEQLESFR